MRRLKIKVSIRTQLLVIVLTMALLSLLVLALVTGVFFTKNLISTSLEKLQVISQLKGAQISQTYNYNYYQLYSLALREDIKNALTNYRVGNTSEGVFSTGQELLQQYIDSTENFFNAALYSVDGDKLFDVTNVVLQANISNELEAQLKPLGRENETIPLLLQANRVLFTGPILNDTTPDIYGTRTYLFSLTLPVYANSSILISTPDLAGFMTVVINANAMELITTDNAALDTSRVNIIKAVTNPSNISDYLGFSYAFEPAGFNDPEFTTQVFPLENYPLIESVFEDQIQSGTDTHYVTPMNITCAMGYNLIEIAGENWIVFVEQDLSDFLATPNKLAKIIVGVVIGLAVLICLITFPLAYYGVRPIMKLQKATEEITYGRGLGRRSQSSKFFKSKEGFSFKNYYHSRDGSNISVAASSHAQNTVSPRISDLSSPHSNATSTSGHLSSTNGDHFIIPNRISLSKRFITDELSELTELFNAMTDELDKQYTHLEDRVRERTRELEKLKILAESADEAKTVFISQISHELRTPLNGILGLCSVCIAEDDPTSIKESLKLIFRSGELLLHILTELLTFSKNTLKKSKLENKDFKMLEIAWQIKSIFGKLAFDQNVDLTIFIKPNLVRKMILFGDSNRIIQVLMNLVSNSLKFTPIDGKVDVRIRCLGEYDEDRSRAADYKKVYTKHNITLEDEPHKDDHNEDTRSLSEKSFIQFDNDDIQSIHTISTTEYNNAIFESQFRKRFNNHSSENSPTSTTDVGSSRNSTFTNQDSDKFSNSDDTDVQYDTAGGDDEGDDEIKHYKVKQLEETKTWVMEFVVQDTGPGIDPKLREKVFEPFIQGDQTLSRSHGGTGLGLSICRQLASMMHGTLELESDVGKGSKFIFRIPVPQVKELQITSKKDEEDLYDDEFNPDSKKTRRVKIVEPNESIPMSIRRSSGEESNSLKSRGSQDANLLKLNIPTSNTPITLQFLPQALQSPSSSIQSASYFVDKPSLLTKSSTGTAHSVPSSSNNSSSTNSSPISNYTTPKSLSQTRFPTMSSPQEVDDRSATASPERPSLKILVAEDNLVNQEVIKRMLILEGFNNIKLACDGQELIDFLKLELDKDQDYDLIFMDVQMPKLDGVSATEYIRNEMNYKGPIVALTLYADESNVAKCLECGMSGFLAKPIRRGQLKKIIQEFGYSNPSKEHTAN